MADPADWSRREFVATAVAASQVVVAGCRAGPPARLVLGSSELAELGAVDAVRGMVSGDFTAERYAGALLDACRANKSLNAFITLAPDRVLEAARAADRRRAARGTLGALHGLPIPIKDSVDTKDLPTTAGTPALRRFQPAADAPVIARLRAAGAYPLGKTNLHEMSFGWTSANQAFGPVRNPYDPTRIPGGSSGGTAVAVAARMAPLGVAEDTEGSIRVPAAMCGIFGFRPTTGRYPAGGVVPITNLFDQVGPHARSVSDLVLFDQVAGPDSSAIVPADPTTIKLAIVRSYYFTGVENEILGLTDEALGKLRAAGVQIVEGEIPDLARLIGLVTGPVQIHDAYYTIKQYLADERTGVTIEQLVEQASPDIKQIFQQYVIPGGKGAIPDPFYRAAVETHWPALKDRFRGFFAETGVTAIVFPTAMTAAVPIDRTTTVVLDGRKVPFDAAISRNIAPGSTVGLPGLVVPVALNAAGLPVTIELDAPSGKDRELLAAGLAIEKILGRIRPPPSISA